MIYDIYHNTNTTVLHILYVDHNDCSFLLDTRTTRISSSTRTCYECALKNFKELAYQFRQDISSDDLPGKWLIAECTYTIILTI